MPAAQTKDPEVAIVTVQHGPDPKVEEPSKDKDSRVFWFGSTDARLRGMDPTRGKDRLPKGGRLPGT